MNRTLLPLAGLLVSGAPLLAQIVSVPTFSPAVTTGAVGLAGSQTAQLNVVNLNTASATTTTTTATLPCMVQLEFWDSKGNLVKSMAISNLGAGATASLAIKFTDVTTTPPNTSPMRTEIRGVVRRTVPTTGVTATPTPMPQPITFIPPSCSVATTLEVFDNLSGVTQALTSDLHALEEFTVMPLASATGR